MTAGTIRSADNIGGIEGGSVRPRSARVSKLVAELRSLLEKGEPASACAYLKAHPDLQNDLNAVVELGYEEYCQRLELGEKVDVERFVAQFPCFGSEVAKLIALHEDVEVISQVDQVVQEIKPWPKVGQKFGGYQLIREVGRGSFARVYYAMETAIGNRPVALKVSECIGAEADILGQLTHPNIVPIYSTREEPSIRKSVVCMPYLGKATLNDLLERAFAGRELPGSAEVIREVAQPEDWEPPATPVEQRPGDYVDGVVQLGIQLADALAFVHKRSIFHRDLKPSNVLLTAAGRPMLLDFNLSIEERAYKKGEDGGTVEYMSPELLRMVSKDYSGPPFVLDARSDIFSLGVILYELLAGVHPFGPLPPRGTSRCMRHLLKHHPQGPAALCIANPHVSKRLAGIVEKCLSPDPQRRLASAEELRRALVACRSPFEKIQAWMARHATGVKRGILVAGLAGVLFSAAPLLREPASVVNQREGIKAVQTNRYAEAIDYFTKALGNGSNAAAHFGRGWAYLGSGQNREALQDFERADKLGGNGRTKASMAEALARLGSWVQAALFYEKAIEAGYETAPVLNNLAACCLQKPELRSKAETCLAKALERDPNLRTAYYNLVTLELHRAATNPQRAKAGIAAAKQLLALGELNGFLYYDLARLYAFAAKEDTTAAAQALRYAAKAVEHGAPPGLIRDDPLLSARVGNAQLEQIIRTCRPDPPVRRPSPFVNLDMRFE